MKFIALPSQMHAVNRKRAFPPEEKRRERQLHLSGYFFDPESYNENILFLSCQAIEFCSFQGIGPVGFVVFSSAIPFAPSSILLEACMHDAQDEASALWTSLLKLNKSFIIPFPSFTNSNYMNPPPKSL